MSGVYRRLIGVLDGFVNAKFPSGKINEMWHHPAGPKVRNNFLKILIIYFSDNFLLGADMEMVARYRRFGRSCSTFASTLTQRISSSCCQWNYLHKMVSNQHQQYHKLMITNDCDTVYHEAIREKTKLTLDIFFLSSSSFQKILHKAYQQHLFSYHKTG